MESNLTAWEEFKLLLFNIIKLAEATGDHNNFTKMWDAVLVNAFFRDVRLLDTALDFVRKSYPPSKAINIATSLKNTFFATLKKYDNDDN